MSTDARLLIAASEGKADMLYISGLFVPDPFIAIEIAGRWHGLFSPLEVDRARKQSKFAEVHLDTSWRDAALQQGRENSLVGAAAAFLAEHGATRLTVPADFPLAYADKLRGWGFDVRAAESSLFPERALKSAAEIAHIAHAEKLTARSMQRAHNFLAACSVGNDGILRDPESGKRLRSADLRRAIEVWLIAHGAVPSHTIVACGREGADPHQVGHGYLRANRPIIVDIFPRVVATGYWGDMTRTFLKGRASPELKKMYGAVRDGQKLGLGMIADGVDGAAIHRAIADLLTARGFPTGMRRGKQIGFFHGTGHGVGLEVHEAPRISTRSDLLRSGHVVTVEPGLYYPQLGGIRLEDLVVVQSDGCRNLTNYPCRFEID